MSYNLIISEQPGKLNFLKILQIVLIILEIMETSSLKEDILDLMKIGTKFL